jgi:lysophospholipid acyltransferase (LPLAT)-like uncharacterized protein
MFKRITRSKPVQVGLGRLLAFYLRVVKATSRITFDPPEFASRVIADAPIICALWHGQHFMIPLVRPTHLPFAVLISRHGDGAINAAACDSFGIRPIRGSGGRPEQIVRKGGVAGLRALNRALENGESVTLTADIPKIARVAGLGIVTLARMSGRPIYPTAVVSSHRYVAASWDKATIALPFGRMMAVIGPPVRVAREADEAAMEAARRAVQAGLDDAHARAYALIGHADPGADIRRGVA